MFNFQSVVCKNCTKLEIDSLHNLNASMKYYVLTQYVSGLAVQVSNDCTSIVKQILQSLMGTDLTTKALFLKQIFGC